MAKQVDKTLCLTPTAGKKPTRIDTWKYEAVRAAILRAVGGSRAGISFAALPERVENLMRKRDLERLGSVSWYTTTVKLDLEVKGELERVPGREPQHLRRPT